MTSLVLLLVVLSIVTALEAAFGPGQPRRSRRANLALVLPVLVIASVTDLVIAAATTISDDHDAGLLPWLGVSGTAAAVVGVILLDLFAYLNHRVRHAVRPLWALHRTHHTDVDVDGTTTFRQHPLDVVVLNLGMAATIAVAGIGATSVVLLAAAMPVVGLFAHARVRLPNRVERALALVVQTPGLHRVHHSPHHRETDSNLGLVLTLWDRMFGTYNPPNPAGPAGLDTVDLDRRQTVAAMLAEPWRPLVKDGLAARPAGRQAIAEQAG